MKILSPEEFKEAEEIIKRLQELSGRRYEDWGRRTDQKQFDLLQQIGYFDPKDQFGRNSWLTTWFFFQSEVFVNEDSKRNVERGHPFYGVIKNGKPSKGE